MVLRSCLCYKKCPTFPSKRTITQQSRTVLTVKTKYPGVFHPRQQQRMFTASINSIGKQIEKIEITPIVSSPADAKDLYHILNNEFTAKQAKAFYHRLALSKDVYSILLPHLESLEYQQLRNVLLNAADYWSVEMIHEIMSLCDGKYVKWRLDLLSRLLSSYVLNRNLDQLLGALPSTGPRSDILPFYNAVLNKCLKQKEYNHVQQVMELMKERGIDPDTATFNILTRMKLLSSKTPLSPEQSFGIYKSMITQGIQPNHATFNTFIKHACNHKQWDSLKTWLDMMEEDNIEPNPVTSRILFKSYVEYPTSSELSQAFERVSKAVPLKGKERFLNTGVSTLLKVKQTKAAMDLLDKTFALDEPLSVYSYNLLIQALCLDGKLETAHDVLDSMILSGQDKKNIPKPDIVSFTTLIHGLVRSTNNVELNQLSTLYKQLMDQGLRTNNVLDSVVFYGLVRSDNNKNLTKVKAMFELMLANKNLVKLPRQHADTSLDEINIYNMMMDFYFLHYHHSKTQGHRTPTEPFALLEDAVERRKLKPTVCTLNILVRGLAILNKDLNAAEKMVTLLKEKGVEMDEKTVWYLTKSAYAQGQIGRARQWIETFETQNQSVKGSGLIHLKSILTKWDKKEQE